MVTERSFRSSLRMLTAFTWRRKAVYSFQYKRKEGARGTMRNPENVLNSLQKHSNSKDYTYNRLYRNMFNRNLFLQAYQNIYSKQGNMTAGTDGKTIDAMSIERIDRIIETLKDERFINLIRKFLNAGYMEQQELHPSYSGTPQGGIISPILANIYLDQFDKYMAEYKKQFDLGKKRAYNREYAKMADTRHRLLIKLNNSENQEEKQYFLTQIKELDKIHRTMPCKEPMDSNFKRLQYVRYCDDFIIGIIGSKEDAKKVKEEIGQFIQNKLHLELSNEKTLITKATNKARFLGFDIRVTPKSNLAKKTKRGIKARNYGGHVMLEVPTELIQKKLIELKAMKIVINNNTEIWKSIHRGDLTGRNDLGIIDQYNGEIRGLCNYYSIANNRSKLHKFRYIMEYSFYRTMACKYRTSVRKIISKFRINKNIGIKYQDNTGDEKIRILWKGSLAKDPIPLGAEVDTIHKPKGVLKRPKLADRLDSNKCEWCGKHTQELEVHQVRTLKELDEKEDWARFMKRINRKTLVVCKDCHSKIHKNKLRE